ncbi:thiol reductant ABC exporter subunit CydD [Pontibacillus litoralis]|uniref:Cysteine ABC transporter ATP-binding protein n=1 Tax=Pontibacillus litoralis JSM 072002 TaxID=1385512 RepID=A0A0A5G442_9BACI|nr:thiol reductant ABC exporter subunit CydD [Pontibacillus litoralis]KGX85855.1 cysteine ABC transporter ATP-binding protein [Pontibacillus litoralis JSM 072002]
MNKALLQYDGMKKIIAILTCLTVVQGLSIILQAVWLAEGVTHLFNGGPIQDSYPTILLFGAAFLLRYIIQHIKQKITYHYAEHLGTKLRKDVLEALFSQGPRISRKLGTGNVVTLLQDGIMQFKQYIQLFLPKMANMAVVPVMIGIYVLTKDITSAIVLFVAVPILVAFMILLGWAAQKKADKQWASYRILSNHFVDSLRGLETLKFLGRSKAHAKSIDQVSEQYRTSTMSTLRMAFLSSFAMDFFTMLSVAIVAVFLGLRLIEGEMVLQPALTILILAPEYFLPIREIGSDYHATLNGQEAGNKLQEIVSTKRLKIEDNHAIPLWNNDSELSFHDVDVYHDEATSPSIHKASLTIKGKKKIGIVGESGAGKSTFIDLIGGFIPTQRGTITIDGQAYTHLQREDWKKQLLYIPQHPYLFQDTIRNNITFYSPNASLEDVHRAVAQAGLTDLINELPNGLDEKIGEGGRTLSGGQAQRVAIARALLENRPILLLDEPTAHLDIETEYDVKEKMFHLFEDKLVFLATHRLHWMMQMDYIYFIHHGDIVEEGTHQQLMEQRGYYYNMVKTQMGDNQ